MNCHRATETQRKRQMERDGMAPIFSLSLSFSVALWHK